MTIAAEPATYHEALESQLRRMRWGSVLAVELNALR